MEKREARREALNSRRGLSEAYVADASSEIVRKFLSEFGDEGSYLLYHSYGNEVATTSLIDCLYGFNKAVYLPVVKGGEMDMGLYDGVESLSCGAYGIMEPVVCSEKRYIDVAVIPGVAFDKRLNRVGYGKGFYDRFLISAEIGVKVGFAFDCQVFDLIACDEHDIHVDLLITDNYIYRRNS